MKTTERTKRLYREAAAKKRRPAQTTRKGPPKIPKEDPPLRLTDEEVLYLDLWLEDRDRRRDARKAKEDAMAKATLTAPKKTPVAKAAVKAEAAPKAASKGSKAAKKEEAPAEGAEEPAAPAAEVPAVQAPEQAAPKTEAPAAPADPKLARLAMLGVPANCDNVEQVKKQRNLVLRTDAFTTMIKRAASLPYDADLRAALEAAGEAAAKVLTMLNALPADYPMPAAPAKAGKATREPKAGETATFTAASAKKYAAMIDAAAVTVKSIRTDGRAEITWTNGEGAACGPIFVPTAHLVPQD